VKNSSSTSSSGSKAVTVTVTLKEFSVSMSPSTVPVGVPVTFKVLNAGKITHELVLEPANVVDEPMMQKGKATEIQDIAPGSTRSATWTVPKAGSYHLSCHVPGHFEAGMVATLKAA
jgi:uncharacterized cupredoxin-like copper-binding protein